MNEDMDTVNGVPETKLAWPYASLILFGFFGARTPEGKKLAWQSALAASIMFAAALAILYDVGGAALQVLWALLIPGGVVGLGWAFFRYLQALDELSQIIQLKAFSVAYGAAMVLYFVSLTHGLADQPPSIFPTGGGLGFWIVAAEPVRGAALVYLARKYS
jgi:hypothetical protein